jgi:hypothetical protein
MYCCPICGRAIETKFEQFRSDDEPATLVSKCPIHGSIGNVCRLYSECANDQIVDSKPEFSAMGCSSTLKEYTIKPGETEQWVDKAMIYVASVDILNCVYSDSDTASYITLSSFANVDRINLLCARHYNHPLYNHTLGYEDGIGCVIFSSKNVGPVSISSVRLLDGLSHTIKLSDLHIVECQWMCLVSTEAEFVVCYESTGSNVSKLVSISNEKSTTLQLLHAHYASIKGPNTEICKSPSVRSWISSVYSVTNSLNTTIVRIGKSTLDGSESGTFISAPGLPIILCIDGDLVVYILLTGFKCHLCSVCCATQNNNCKGIFKAYMS